ncbi:MAG: glycosyltransferase family 39 protein [Planctomycetia bacterium]|nr:glycosyltransferase family 39 protein [Planctomycetia bacterium]
MGSLRNKTGLFIGTLALVFLLTFYKLGDRELWSSHEARAAQDAQSILDGCDWRLPRLFDGRPELQKPPLYYWLTACFGWMQHGVDAWAVRLPAALGSVLTGLAVYLLLKKSGMERAAWLSMICLWTMVHFTWMSRVGRIDMPLTAAITWCLVSFYCGMQSIGYSRNYWYALGYLSLTAGIMLKGPIALVLVGLVIVSCFVAQTLANRIAYPSTHTGINFRSLVFSVFWGIPLIVILVLPWAWWVNQETAGKFLEEFVIKHNVQRGLGGDEQLDGHLHPWWYYLLRIWLDTAPWGLLLPVCVTALIQRKLTSRWAITGLAWFLSILIFLSCMQYKRADYLLPAYPGLAILIGVCIDQWLRQWNPARQHAAIWTGTILIAMTVTGWFTYVQWIIPSWEPERSLSEFARKVRNHVPSPGQVILFRIDSHYLAWELGKPAERIWEWENLGWWATRKPPIYVVMPERYAKECLTMLPEGELHPLLSTLENDNGKHDLPLVLLVNQPPMISQKSIVPTHTDHPGIAWVKIVSVMHSIP